LTCPIGYAIIYRMDTNWMDVIRDLRVTGMTQAEIGAACGLSQNFISDLGRGERTDLMHAHGVKLLELWTQRVAK